MARVTVSGRTFWPGAITLAMLFSDLLSAQQAGEVRRIPFQAPRPIFELLVPGDRVVAIDDPKIIEATYEFPPTVDEEIETVSRMPCVLVFKVVESRSSVIRNGAWVRTRVTGTIEYKLRDTGSIAPTDQLTFEFDNGEIELSGVTVKAGRYPIFLPNSRYLGLFILDPSTGLLNLGRGFRIDSENKIARLGNWDGSINWFSGPLVGVPLSTVIERLTPKFEHVNIARLQQVR